MISAVCLYIAVYAANNIRSNVYCYSVTKILYSVNIFWWVYNISCVEQCAPHCCVVLCPVSSAAVRVLSTLGKNTIRLDAGPRTSHQGLQDRATISDSVVQFKCMTKNDGQFFVFGRSGGLEKSHH